jgi:hypothetical protein
VEVLFKHNRVASHAKSFLRGKHTTLQEHMPSSHRRYAEWTPERIRRWAATVGPETEGHVVAIMEHRTHPEQGFRAALAKADLLIIDDWGLAPLDDGQRRDLLEIMDDRHINRSTLITSQLPVENWHEMIGDGTLADAILDRLVHNAHKIKMKGESMRKRRAQTKDPLTETRT